LYRSRAAGQAALRVTDNLHITAGKEHTMPDERKESKRMAREHGATILTEIYQSQLKQGVCRGMVQYWLASQLADRKGMNPDLIGTFRAEAADIKKNASKFEALHSDYNLFHGKDDVKGLDKEKQMASMQKSFNQLSLNYGIADWTHASYSVYALGQITFYFNQLFPKEGLYYIGISDQHGMGLYNDADHILFLDANTCEWQIPKARSAHKAFLVDYIATLYTDMIGEKIMTMHFT
jgi:hypothetical protein